MHSRFEILLDSYCKTINIEAVTMLQMAKKSIMPAVIAYTRELTETALAKEQLGVNADTEKRLSSELSSLLSCFISAIDRLDQAMINVKDTDDIAQQASDYREHVFAAMQEVRGVSDRMETIVSKKYWPWPTYGDLLFSV